MSPSVRMRPSRNSGGKPAGTALRVSVVFGDLFSVPGTAPPSVPAAFCAETTVSAIPDCVSFAACFAASSNEGICSPEASAGPAAVSFSLAGDSADSSVFVKVTADSCAWLSVGTSASVDVSDSTTEISAEDSSSSADCPSASAVSSGISCSPAGISAERIGSSIGDSCLGTREVFSSSAGIKETADSPAGSAKTGASSHGASSAARSVFEKSSEISVSRKVFSGSVSVPPLFPTGSSACSAPRPAGDTTAPADPTERVTSPETGAATSPAISATHAAGESMSTGVSVSVCTSAIAGTSVSSAVSAFSVGFVSSGSPDSTGSSGSTGASFSTGSPISADTSAFPGISASAGNSVPTSPRTFADPSALADSSASTGFSATVRGSASAGFSAPNAFIESASAPPASPSCFRMSARIACSARAAG